MDVESIPSEHGDVVGLTGVGFGVELGRQTVLLRQAIDVGCSGRRTDDLPIALVFSDDYEDVRVTRYRRVGRAHDRRADDRQYKQQRPCQERTPATDTSVRQ